MMWRPDSYRHSLRTVAVASIGRHTAAYRGGIMKDPTKTPFPIPTPDPLGDGAEERLIAKFQQILSDYPVNFMLRCFSEAARREAETVVKVYENSACQEEMLLLRFLLYDMRFRLEIRQQP
jgi:hypothetical protein